MTPLSPHFSVEEMCATSRKVSNLPSPQNVENLRRLCVNVLEPLRAALGTPIRVNSGYRSPELNKLVGGVSNSQHMNGEAADIEAPPLGNKRLAEMIRGLGLPFDQLLLEHVVDDDPFSGWVHVSHRLSGNRGEFLVIPRPRTAKE